MNEMLLQCYLSFSSFKLCYFKNRTSAKVEPNVIELNAFEVGSYHNRRFNGQGHLNTELHECDNIVYI